MILVPERPLEDAFLRVERAGEHIHDLDGRIGDYLTSHGQLDFAQFDPEKTEERFNRLSPIPPVVYILIGEALYNLRAALDYLVFTLALIDSGKPQAGTQFPIENTPEGFVSRVRGKRGVYLIGLNTCHIRMIEQLQPYRGCRWTWNLRELSNPDKHRHLSVLGRTFLYTPKQRADSLAAGSQDEVNVDSSVALNVAFQDFSPVIPKLQELKTGVAQTLAEFKAVL